MDDGLVIVLIVVLLVLMAAAAWLLLRKPKGQDGRARRAQDGSSPAPLADTSADPVVPAGSPPVPAGPGSLVGTPDPELFDQEAPRPADEPRSYDDAAVQASREADADHAAQTLPSLPNESDEVEDETTEDEYVRPADELQPLPDEIPDVERDDAPTPQAGAGADDASVSEVPAQPELDVAPSSDPDADLAPAAGLQQQLEAEPAAAPEPVPAQDPQPEPERAPDTEPAAAPGASPARERAVVPDPQPQPEPEPEPAADPAAEPAPDAEVEITTAEFDEAFEEAIAATDTGASDAEAVEEPSFEEGPYGPSSAQPAVDGTGPTSWEVKGTQGSMLFHTPESPSFHQTRADVWFESEDAAKAAGFAHWDRKRR